MQQNELRCLAEGLLFLVRQNDLLPLSDDFWQREMCANRKNMTHMYDEYISVCSQYICIYIYITWCIIDYNSIYMNISISDHFWDTNMMPIQLRSKHWLVE